MFSILSTVIYMHSICHLFLFFIESIVNPKCIFLFEVHQNTLPWFLISLFCSPKLHLFDDNSSFLCEYVLNCNLFLYFQHHYSSLQCHMIFRNHNNIKKHFWLLSMLKTVVLHNIFYRNWYSLMNIKFQRTRYTVWMVIYWNSNVNIIFWDTDFWLSLAVINKIKAKQLLLDM